VLYSGAVRRWDIYLADLDPSVGSEQGGEKRPVIVISNDGVNNSLNVVTVVSLTKIEGKRRKVYRFEVEIPKNILGTDHDSIVMPQQIRSISKLRLLTRISRLEDEGFWAQIENRLLEHLDIAFEADDEP
jgi:mRNA interferase MazF